MACYLSTFMSSEDGIETIEFIGLLIVSSVLIGAVATIMSKQISSLKSYDDVAVDVATKDLKILFRKNNSIIPSF